MRRNRLPNLFIVGAPKCGTTALSRILADHPAIFLTENVGLKEPDYFDTDLDLSHMSRRIRSWDEYLALFDSAPDRAEYLGEASPLYLFSQCAVPAIEKTCPSARYLVSLRDPVELVVSLHNQHSKHGVDVLDFEEAWRLQERRAQGYSLPRDFSSGQLLQYGKIASIGEQMERLFRLVPRGRVYTIFHEDLENNPQDCYRSILKWLELPNDYRRDFPRLNESVEYRIPRLEIILRSAKEIRRSLGISGGLGIHRIINRYNRKPGRAQISMHMRDELRRYFAPEISRLENALGRDLSHWRN